MRWIGNKYVDDDGRIVAEVDEQEGVFQAMDEIPQDAGFIGSYITEADAKRAVERWWVQKCTPPIGIKLREPQ